MKQSRKASFAEACLNTAIGYVVSLGAQIVIFPAFGIAVSLSANAALAAAFTVISIVRGYAVRRMFEALRG